MTLTGGGEAQVVNARMVTADYFRVMRVRPMLGRDFDHEEDRFGAPRVVVLSHAYWQSQFGSDTEIIGKPITLDNSHNVVTMRLLPHQAFTERAQLTEFTRRSSNESARVRASKRLVC